MGNIVVGSNGSFVYANSPDRTFVLNVSTIGPVQTSQAYSDSFQGQQAHNLTDSLGITAPLLISPALSSIGLTTLGWAGAGGAIAGVSDAAGQYIQNGTVRWEQSLFATISSGVTTPLGMRYGAFGNALLGTATGAANTEFKNSYFGDSNSIIWGGVVGGVSGAGGYKAGITISSRYPVFQPNIPALIQKPNMTGFYIGNIGGGVLQGIPSLIDTDISNKRVP